MPEVELLGQMMIQFLLFSVYLFTLLHGGYTLYAVLTPVPSGFDFCISMTTLDTVFSCIVDILTGMVW